MLYNVTVGVDKEIEGEWLSWMKTTQIPAEMNTGMFVACKIFKILHDEDEATTSYSIQYFAESINEIQQYLEHHAPALVERHRKKFENRHVAFRTLLEEV